MASVTVAAKARVRVLLEQLLQIFMARSHVIWTPNHSEAWRITVDAGEKGIANNNALSTYALQAGNPSHNGSLIDANFTEFWVTSPIT